VGRVLIVDDYPPLANVLAIGLRRRGHQVTSVGSKLRAERALEESTYDCAVLDMDLPDGSGLELARTVLQGQRVLSVVFFSANDEHEVMQQALQFGPLVSKSSGLDTVLNLVDEQLLVLRRKVANAEDTPAPRLGGVSGFRRRVR